MRSAITSQREESESKQRDQIGSIFSCLAQSKTLLDFDMWQFMHHEDFTECPNGFFQTRKPESNFEREVFSVTDWFLTVPSLWNMLISHRERDLCACRDLLHAVNANRLKAGLGMAFVSPIRPLNSIEKQAQWLVMLPSLEQYIANGDDQDWWGAQAQDSLEQKLWNEYPFKSRRIVHQAVKPIAP